LKRADPSDKTHDGLRSFKPLLATFVRNAAGKWESPHFAIVASKIVVIAEQGLIWDSVSRLADEQAFKDRYRENDVVVVDSLEIEKEEEETMEQKEAKRVRFMDAREVEKSLHKEAVTAANAPAKAAAKAANAPAKAAAKAANAPAKAAANAVAKAAAKAANAPAKAAEKAAKAAVFALETADSLSMLKEWKGEGQRSMTDGQERRQVEQEKLFEEASKAFAAEMARARMRL